MDMEAATIAGVIRVGQPVTYVSKGREKAALVLATASSIEPGGPLAVPEEGSAHLVVFAPTGSVYYRGSVPMGSKGDEGPVFIP